MSVQPEPVVYREEVAAKLFAIADNNANVWVIRELLEEENGGEGLPEDHA